MMMIIMMMRKYSNNRFSEQLRISKQEQCNLTAKTPKRKTGEEPELKI